MSDIIILIFYLKSWDVYDEFQALENSNHNGQSLWCELGIRYYRENLKNNSLSPKKNKSDQRIAKYPYWPLFYFNLVFD